MTDEFHEIVLTDGEARSVISGLRRRAHHQRAGIRKYQKRGEHDRAESLRELLAKVEALTERLSLETGIELPEPTRHQERV